MHKNMSQDINLLFQSYGVQDPIYIEMTEKERYEQVKKKWIALHRVKLNIPMSTDENQR